MKSRHRGPAWHFHTCKNHSISRQLSASKPGGSAVRPGKPVIWGLSLSDNSCNGG